MRRSFSLVLAVLVGSIASAQEPDSSRVGIHQLESEWHRWDDVRTDTAVPAFERGRQLAIEGRLAEAELEFRKGLTRRRAVAEFNLGLLDHAQRTYWSAYKHFRTAYRMKRDPMFRDYLRKARRLAGLQRQAP